MHAGVELGTLLDTKTFEWLDAFETKETAFWISLQPPLAADADAAATPLSLEPVPGGLAMPGFSLPLH